jgi:hypothetical protein
MKNSSGIKAIDTLINKYGVMCSETNNPFQQSIVIPPCLDRISLSHAISSFGLNKFPPSIWLTLSNDCLGKETILHKFTLNDKGGVSWVLMSNETDVLKIAISNHRPIYVAATKFIKGALRQNDHNMDMFQQIAV